MRRHEAVEILNNSPYKTQLGQCGLVPASFAEPPERSPEPDQRASGNRVADHAGSQRPRQSIRSRIRRNAGAANRRSREDGSWNDKLELIKSKPTGAVAEREKMPFEVTTVHALL